MNADKDMAEVCMGPRQGLVDSCKRNSKGGDQGRGPGVWPKITQKKSIFMQNCAVLASQH